MAGPCSAKYQIYDPEGREYDYREELPAWPRISAWSVQPCGLWTVSDGLWDRHDLGKQ